MEQHLTWNPNDNIGIRYIIGETYHSAPECIKKRRNIF